MYTNYPQSYVYKLPTIPCIHVSDICNAFSCSMIFKQDFVNIDFVEIAKFKNCSSFYYLTFNTRLLERIFFTRRGGRVSLKILHTCTGFHTKLGKQYAFQTSIIISSILLFYKNLENTRKNAFDFKCSFLLQSIWPLQKSGKFSNYGGK